MVVQCEQCQTKYRIADEKVKGKGVKVRCAKCDNVFTVTPPAEESPAPLPEAGPPAPPPSTPEPPVSAPAEPEIPAPETTASDFEIDAVPPGTDETGPGLSDEAASELPVSDPFEGAASLPPLPSPDSSLDQTAPEAASPGSPLPESGSLEPDPQVQPSGGYIPPTPSDGPLDLGAQRPAHELDQATLVSHPPEPGGPPEENGMDDGGFELEATLREDTAPGIAAPDAGSGDLPPLTQEGAPDGEWGNIPIEGQDGPGEGGEFGLAGEPGYVPPPPMPMEEPADPQLPDQWEADPHDTPSVPSYQPEVKSSGGGKKAVILLILLAALGAGGYFAYPTVMEMVKARAGQTEGTLTPANIQVKAINRADGKIIYSVRGEIRNESQGNVGMIQVEAQFRNASGDVLRKAASFCGNMIPDSDLARLEMGKIRTDLQNELGQSLSNANVMPGQVVPFLVILDDPPAGINKVTVTILSFEETT